MCNRVAFVGEFLQGFVHARTACFIDFDARNTRVFATRTRDGHAVLDALRNAVAAVGRNAHRHPIPVGAEGPVAHMIDGSVGR